MRDDRPMERTAGMVTGLVAVKRARASLPGQDLPRAAESAFREAGTASTARRTSADLPEGASRMRAFREAGSPRNP